MNSMYVKPKVEGSIVRMPERGNQPMPSYGAEVPRSVHWIRRLNDGSVVDTTKEAVAKGEAATKPVAKKGDK